MVLIIGGAASGKRTYLKTLGYAPEAIADGVLDDKKILYGLEKLVAADPDRAVSLLPDLLQKEVVACCEVGSGVIPLQYASDRPGKPRAACACSWPPMRRKSSAWWRASLW